MTARPRILFFGYSEVGHECLELLLARGDNVVALITHEDNPNEKIWFKTPAVAAREQGIPVFTPESVNNPEWRERIAAFKPDLILMDIQLPEVSGLEVTKWLKEDDTLKAIPVVAVTAFAMKGDEEVIRQGGCEAYISKPISVTSFLDTVRRFIG